MFVIGALSDLRCLREARALPAGLLERLEADFRESYTRMGETIVPDAFSLYDVDELMVVLQPGDGPSVYALLGIVEAEPVFRGTLILQDTCGGHVVYQEVEFSTAHHRVRLYLPSGKEEEDDGHPKAR